MAHNLLRLEMTFSSIKEEAGTGEPLLCRIWRGAQFGAGNGEEASTDAALVSATLEGCSSSEGAGRHASASHRTIMCSPPSS